MSEARAVGNESGATRDPTAFQQNTLVTLTEESMYGLVTKCHLESYYDTKVNHGRLYPSSDDLVKMDLVGKSELNKRTNQHELIDDDLQAVFNRFDWMLTKLVTDSECAEMVSELVESKL